MVSHYEGILSGYPRLRRRIGKISDYIMLMRPLTLVAPALAGFFGVLIQLASYGRLDLFLSNWNVIIYVAVTMLLAQGAGQAINQATDVEIDMINKPYRPIPSGRITREEALGLGYLILIVSLVRSFTINTTFGLLMSLILFFAVFYNLKPIRAKGYFGLNLVWMSISRGLLPFLASWSVFGDITDLKPWVLGLIATLWCLSWQSTKDFPDIEGDRRYGIQTLPVRLGERKAKRFMISISPVPFVTLLLCVYYKILEINYLLLLIILFIAVMNAFSINKASKITENTVAWVGFYAGLGLIYLLAFISEVLPF